MPPSATQERRQTAAEEAPPSPTALRGSLPANPHSDPIAYLQEKGWKCLGNAEWPSALWLDPEQPLVAHYTRERCTYMATVREPYRDPVDGMEKIRFREEERQILCQDGRVGQQQLAERWVYHPKVTPVSVGQALMVQLERDALAQQKAMAEKEKRKSA